MSTDGRLLATALALAVTLSVIASMGAASTAPVADATTPETHLPNTIAAGIAPPGIDRSDRQTSDGDGNQTRTPAPGAPDGTADDEPPSNVTSGVAEKIQRWRSGDTEFRRITVRVTAKTGAGDRAVDLATAAGGRVLARADDRFVVRMPTESVLEIKDRPPVRTIQLPERSHPAGGPIVSEGIYNISADDLQDRGITGENVTVAVIDIDGEFDATNDEIDDNVVDVKDMTDGELFVNRSGGHGTAVAETVVDVAPNVSLSLIEEESATEVHAAIDYARTNVSADVVVMSVNFGAGPHDGSGFIGDAIADARDAGIPMFVSAGNYADGQHLNLTWNDPDGDDALNFDGSDERLTVTGGASDLFVSWNDYPTSNEDYDVYLYNQSGGLEDSSTDPQNGDYQPDEEIQTDNCPCQLEIVEVSANGTADFDIFTYDLDLEYSTATRSVGRPATDEAAIATGAVYYGDLELESFSSRGPTVDGRRKPELVAPDGASNSVYGLAPGQGFYGTSQAAPHAAGAAALLKAANESFTAEEIESALRETARQSDPTFETPDPNNQTGNGLVNVSAALDYLRSRNDPPTANDDAYATDDETTLSVPAPGVLGNDTDPDGDGLSASLVSGPDHGTVSLNANGSFTYDPDDRYAGEDDFTYQAADGNGGTDTATVTIGVTDADLLTEEWTHNESARLQYSAPALNATHAFVGGLGSDLVAVDRASGEVEWRFSRAGALVDSSPTLHDGRVIVGSGSGTIYAVNSTTGMPDWTNATDSAVVSSPVVADGTVFVGSNDGTLLALNASTGAIEWTSDVGDAVYSTPAVSSSRVVVTTDDGVVVAVDESDGSFAWSRDTGTDLGHASPVIANGTVYVAAEDLYAFDPTTGAVQWQAGGYGGTAGSTPAHDASLGLVVVGSADGSVYAYDSDGTLNWTYESGDPVSAVAIAGDRVVAGSKGTRTYLLEGATGDLLASAATGKVGARPVVDGNVVYLSTWDGRLQALSNVTNVTGSTGGGGTTPWPSPDPVRPGPGDDHPCSDASNRVDATTDECRSVRGGRQHYRLP